MHRLRNCWLVVVVLSSTLLATTLVAAPAQALGTTHILQPPFPFTGTASCPGPTATFDPKAASSAQLAFYGLPARPQGTEANLSHWLDIIGHSRHRVCTNGVAGASLSQPLPLSHTYNSTSNWSGIAAVGSGGYNYAFADWIVPCYTGGNSGTRQVQWVGIGSSNIWQGGTETDYSEGYRFWYEAWPKISMTYAGPAVSCTDHVAVQVDYNTTVANESYIYMSNYTKGQYWSTAYGNGFVPGSNQVEWINERPGCPSNLYALQPTGTTSWTYAQAESRIVNGDALEPAGYFNYQVISMYQGSTELASTSGLQSDQESFYVNYYNTGSSAC